jgi:hypothetical protein
VHDKVDAAKKKKNGKCPRYTKNTMEDFPPLGIPNVHGLIPDSKSYLVVKIIDI